MREAIRDWLGIATKEDVRDYHDELFEHKTRRLIDERLEEYEDLMRKMQDRCAQLEEDKRDIDADVSDLATKVSKLRNEIRRIWKDPGTVGNGE